MKKTTPQKCPLCGEVTNNLISHAKEKHSTYTHTSKTSCSTPVPRDNDALKVAKKALGLEPRVSTLSKMLKMICEYHVESGFMLNYVDVLTHYISQRILSFFKQNSIAPLPFSVLVYAGIRFYDEKISESIDNNEFEDECECEPLSPILAQHFSTQEAWNLIVECYKEADLDITQCITFKEYVQALSAHYNGAIPYNGSILLYGLYLTYLRCCEITRDYSTRKLSEDFIDDADLPHTFPEEEAKKVLDPIPYKTIRLLKAIYTCHIDEEINIPSTFFNFGEVFNYTRQYYPSAPSIGVFIYLGIKFCDEKIATLTTQNELNQELKYLSPITTQSFSIQEAWDLIVTTYENLGIDISRCISEDEYVQALTAHYNRAIPNNGSILRYGFYFTHYRCCEIAKVTPHAIKKQTVIPNNAKYNTLAEEEAQKALTVNHQNTNNLFRAAYMYGIKPNGRQQLLQTIFVPSLFSEYLKKNNYENIPLSLELCLGINYYDKIITILTAIQILSEFKKTILPLYSRTFTTQEAWDLIVTCYAKANIDITRCVSYDDYLQALPLRFTDKIPKNGDIVRYGFYFVYQKCCEIAKVTPYSKMNRTPQDNLKQIETERQKKRQSNLKMINALIDSRCDTQTYRDTKLFICDLCFKQSSRGKLLLDTNQRFCLCYSCYKEVKDNNPQKRGNKHFIIYTPM